MRSSEVCVEDEVILQLTRLTPAESPESRRSLGAQGGILVVYLIGAIVALIAAVTGVTRTKTKQILRGFLLKRYVVIAHRSVDFLARPTISAFL